MILFYPGINCRGVITAAALHDLRDCVLNSTLISLYCWKSMYNGRKYVHCPSSCGGLDCYVEYVPLLSCAGGIPVLTDMVEGRRLQLTLLPSNCDGLVQQEFDCGGPRY